MVQNYYSLIKKVRELRKNYKNLSIDEKLNLLNLEIKLESKCIKIKDCHTKAEKKALKNKEAKIRRNKIH